MKKTKRRFLTVADPVSGFHPQAETTFFLLEEITRLGCESLICEPRDLMVQDGEVFAWARAIEVRRKGKNFNFKWCDEQKVALAEIDAVWVRKDPPVDENYLTHLSLLEIAEANAALAGRPLFLNSPLGIRQANEKLFPLLFEGLSPSTLVSFRRDEMTAFVKRHRSAVLKPLNGSGGRGIFLLRADDPNLGSLLEQSTHDFSRAVMLQKYLPAAKRGDKRILLFDGEILGSFLRVPAREDFRGNMHSGARWVKSGVTAREKEMVKRLLPRLQSLNLFFVGLDFIGGYVTEINSTSPMGLREIETLSGRNPTRLIFESVFSRLTKMGFGR